MATSSADASGSLAPGPPQPLPSFAAAVTEAKKQLGLPWKDLYAALDIGKTQFHDGYLHENEWPDRNFGALCRLLKFKFDTKEEARKLYQFGDVDSRKPKPDTFASVIAKLDSVCFPEREEASQQVDLLILQLIERMGSHHFWFGTTQSIPLAPFSGAFPKVPPAVYAAMDKKALFGFVIPSDARIRDLRTNYTYSSDFAHSELVNRFDKLFEGYVQHLTEQSPPCDLPRHVAGCRMQLFQSSDFPVTPCQQTVTLLGEYHSHGHASRRVLLRVPVDRGHGALLAPKNDAREELLTKFLRTVMNRSDNQVRRDHQSGFAPDDDARQKFIDDMVHRLSARLV